MIEHLHVPQSEFDLDPILRGRPIILQSKDGHALWVSSKVMDNMSHIPDSVEGGIIIRDECGKPTGMRKKESLTHSLLIMIMITGVLLDNAQELVQKSVLTEDDLLMRFHSTVNKAISVGLTSIHDAGFNPTSLEFFRRCAH